jgi:hypothetical protein
MHAQDQIVQLARKVGSDDRSTNDLDLFAAHAVSEGREGLISNLFLAVIAIAVLLGSLALLWR